MATIKRMSEQGILSENWPHPWALSASPFRATPRWQSSVPERCMTFTMKLLPFSSNQRPQWTSLTVIPSTTTQTCPLPEVNTSMGYLTNFKLSIKQAHQWQIMVEKNTFLEQLFPSNDPLYQVIGLIFLTFSRRCPPVPGCPIENASLSHCRSDYHHQCSTPGGPLSPITAKTWIKPYIGNTKHSILSVKDYIRRKQYY